MSPSATMWFLDVLIRRILLKIWKTPLPRIGSFFFLALKPVVWNFCLPPSGIESNYTLTLLMHAYEVCLQASSRPPPSYPRNAHFKSSLKAGFIFLSGASETSFGCFLKYFRHWLRCAPSCCSLLLRFGRFPPLALANRSLLADVKHYRCNSAGMSPQTPDSKNEMGEIYLAAMGLISLVNSSGEGLKVTDVHLCVKVLHSRFNF